MASYMSVEDIWRQYGGFVKDRRSFWTKAQSWLEGNLATAESTGAPKDWENCTRAFLSSRNRRTDTPLGEEYFGPDWILEKERIEELMAHTFLHHYNANIRSQDQNNALSDITPASQAPTPSNTANPTSQQDEEARSSRMTMVKRTRNNEDLPFQSKKRRASLGGGYQEFNNLREPTSRSYQIQSMSSPVHDDLNLYNLFHVMKRRWGVPSPTKNNPNSDLPPWRPSSPAHQESAAELGQNLLTATAADEGSPIAMALEQTTTGNPRTIRVKVFWGHYDRRRHFKESDMRFGSIDAFFEAVMLQMNCEEDIRQLKFDFKEEFGIQVVDKAEPYSHLDFRDVLEDAKAHRLLNPSGSDLLKIELVVG